MMKLTILALCVAVAAAAIHRIPLNKRQLEYTPGRWAGAREMLSQKYGVQTNSSSTGAVTIDDYMNAQYYGQ